MRVTAGNPAAPAARCRKVRRGNFMMLPPQSAPRYGHAIRPDAFWSRLHLPCERVEGPMRAPGTLTGIADWLNVRAAPKADLLPKSAFYIDRILKGARPGDLPVQAPTN